MAGKRMFKKEIIDSDEFLDMPLSTQALYFHLNMRADDDGFVSNPKRIRTLIGASEDDLKLLIMKSYLISFEDGVMVIKHWRIHNTIRKDRYTETMFLEEKGMLEVKKNAEYTLEQGQYKLDGCELVERQPVGNQSATQYSIDKNRSEKSSKEKNSKVYFDDSDLNTAFEEFVKMRKKIKKPMTDHAVELSKKKLTDLGNNDIDTMIAILNQSIMNCWQGFFPLKEDKQLIRHRSVDEWDNV